MTAGARLLLSWRLPPFTRRALLVLCLWCAGAKVALACRSLDLVTRGEVEGTSSTWQDQLSVWYADLTGRYGHGGLGDALEPATLVLDSETSSPACGPRITLAPPLGFEDTAPRLADLDLDGWPEIITVRSHAQQGAQIAIYAIDRQDHSLSLSATTPYIGTRFRWLAPLGAADIDGDGMIEIAYVDRPHLAKTLRIWRYKNGTLAETFSLPGVTNHRIGEVDIAGGIRECGSAPEMIVANADWSQLLALKFDGSAIATTRLGQDTSRAAFARAMACSAP